MKKKEGSIVRLTEDVRALKNQPSTARRSTVPSKFARPDESLFDDPFPIHLESKPIVRKHLEVRFRIN